MSDLFTVSVVIASYARPAGLREAVDSLRRQSRVPEEVVIASWSGDAATQPVVRQLTSEPTNGSRQPVIKGVEVSELGVRGQENAGIEASTGAIVCFMDDDAVARPDWLERLIGHYADRAVGAVGGRDVIRNSDRIPELAVDQVGRVRWFGRLHANHHRFSRGVREVDFLKGCNMSFRRELLVPIDSRLTGVIPYGFEIDMGLGVRRRGHRIVYDPEAAVDHYPSSDMSAGLPGLAYVVNHNQTYILLKHFGTERRVAFLLYTFVVGDRNTIGLLRLPLLMARREWSLEAVGAHFRGKLGGLRTFLAWRKANGRLAVRLTG